MATSEELENQLEKDIKLLKAKNIRRAVRTRPPSRPCDSSGDLHFTYDGNGKRF